MEQKVHSIKDKTRSVDEINIYVLITTILTGFNFLFKEWRVLILAVVVGIISGYVYSEYKKPIYTATTTFVLEEENASSGMMNSLGGIASMAGFDLGSNGGGMFQGDNILDFYKSRLMIENTLLSKVEIEGQSILLVDYYIDKFKLKEKWDKEGLKIPVFKTEMAEDRLVDSLLADIVDEIAGNQLNAFKPDKKLSRMQIQIKSNDEVFAKKFNEQLVKNVNDFYIKTKTKKSKNTVALLEKKLDSVRRIVSGAVNSIAATNDGTPNLNPTRQVLRTGTQNGQITIEANKAILSHLIQNLELSRIAMEKETPLIQVIDSPIFPLPKERAGKVQTMFFGAFFAFVIVSIYLFMRRYFRNFVVEN